MEPVEFQPEPEEKKTEPPTASHPPQPAETSPDKDYVGKLENRLRELAGKLHELENYKLLCEHRILELSPGHPLPVRPVHLGKPSPTVAKGHARSCSIKDVSKLEMQLQAKDEDVMRLQQKLDKLLSENRQLRLTVSKKSGEITTDDSLAFKFDVLAKEKSNLEESLRAEMLSNEEQRNYIEILKQALEAKIQDMGLADLLEQTRGKEGGDMCDVFVKLTTMKKELDERRKEVAKNEGDVADMEGLVVDLKRQNEELKAQLDQLRGEHSKAQEDKGQAAKLLEELNQKVLFGYTVN